MEDKKQKLLDILKELLLNSDISKEEILDIVNKCYKESYNPYHWDNERSW